MVRVRFRHSKSIALLVGALSLAACPSANADNDPCSTVDLRNPGGSMENAPVMNQRNLGTGICYLVTATQFADAFVRSRSGNRNTGLENRISVFGTMTELAAQSRDYRARDPFRTGGGLFCDVINHLRENGACTAKSFPSLGMGGTGQDFMDGILQEEWKSRLDAYDAYKQAAELHREVLSAEPMDLQGLSVAEKKKRTALKKICSTCDFSHAVEVKLPPEVHQITNIVMQNLHDLNSMEFLMQSDPRFAACMDRKNRVSISDLPECRTEPTSSAAMALTGLHRHFDAPNPLPLPISFCGDLLTNAEITLPDGRRRYGAISKCGPHSALVIGRRAVVRDKKPECQFLVRNSWGTGCYQYSSKWTCEGGDIWIDAEALSKSVYGIMSGDNSSK